MIDKFHKFQFSLHNVRPPTRQSLRTQEAITSVSESVEEDPAMSICHRAQQLELCPSTTWKILREDLGLHPCKIQLGQELKPNYHRLCRAFVDWAHNQLEVDTLFTIKYCPLTRRIFG